MSNDILSDQELTPDCGRIQNELSSLLYDELAPEARQVVHAHLAGCAACSQELAALRETRALLARWETPPSGEDAHTLAQEIARRARPAARLRRGNLLRWSARLAGAAAAAVFALALFKTQVSFQDGHLQLGFTLPGATPLYTTSAGNGWEERMHAIAAQEVAQRDANLEQLQEQRLQDYSRMTREERQQEILRLTQTIDLVRAQDKRVMDDRLTMLGRETARADLETRQAVSSLASYVVPTSNPNR